MTEGQYQTVLRSAARSRWASAIGFLNRFIADFGYTPEELKNHIERQFRPGMSWETWGTTWHLDHARPLSAFDLSDPEQFRVATALGNLCVLTPAENIAKGDKVPI